ncbi:Tfp pilus assembly protein FimT/FimU [Acidithiobacillus sp. M4-SHS-6]|uniref:pilus assembly FimT family protein n=1 Tax=Acidithiobacillus sp. M4-SHS-6 TaxID=3383024 RepID=UPI0039BDF0F6
MENVAPKKLRHQQGQGMTEYLIVVALIAISAIAVFSFFGQAMRHQVAGITHELAGDQAAKTEIGLAKNMANSATTTAQKKKTMGDYGSYNDLGK